MVKRGLAFGQHQNGPGAAAEHEITLPVAAFSAGLNPGGTVVNGAPVLDGAAGLARRAASAFGPGTRQQLPQPAGPLGGRMQPGVDGLMADVAKPRLIAAPQPAGDLFRRPVLVQPLDHKGG